MHDVLMYVDIMKQPQKDYQHIYHLTFLFYDLRYFLLAILESELLLTVRVTFKNKTYTTTTLTI